MRLSSHRTPDSTLRSVHSRAQRGQSAFPSDRDTELPLEAQFHVETRAATLFNECYSDDSTIPLSSSRQKRLAELQYVIPASSNCYSEDDDEDTALFMTPRFYRLRFGNTNERTTPTTTTHQATVAAEADRNDDDRAFLRGVIGSVATTFHFNVARVIVTPSNNRALHPPLRFMIHSDVHESSYPICRMTQRYNWVLLLSDGEAPNEARRLMWRSALPLQMQYRGPQGGDAFVYSDRYGQQVFDIAYPEFQSTVASGNDEPVAVTSDPMHIITANMTDSTIHEASRKDLCYERFTEDEID